MSTFLPKPSAARNCERPLFFRQSQFEESGGVGESHTALSEGIGQSSAPSLFVSCTSVSGDHRQQALRTIRTDNNVRSALALVGAVALRSRVTTVKPTPPRKVQIDARVYLLRGLFKVISLGMDTPRGRLAAMGFEADASTTMVGTR